MPVNKKELTELIEKLASGQELVYKLAQTFGGNYCVIALNPPGAKKKYVMRWGKSVEVARASEPFLQADKAKKIAEWVAERHGEAVTAEALKQAL
ncbi:MAG: hypothetical protein ACOZHQ_09125 [Thermodesulfobacteriota bacterium]